MMHKDRDADAWQERRVLDAELHAVWQAAVAALEQAEGFVDEAEEAREATYAETAHAEERAEAVGWLDRVQAHRDLLVTLAGDARKASERSSRGMFSEHATALSSPASTSVVALLCGRGGVESPDHLRAFLSGVAALVWRWRAEADEMQSDDPRDAAIIREFADEVANSLPARVVADAGLAASPPVQQGEVGG